MVRLEWSLANPFGIQIDDSGQVWHAGRVNDVLHVAPDTLIVAADKGGLWRVTKQGDATALSHDWDNPDVLALAVGPAGARHILAAAGEVNGKGALWVSNHLAPDPFRSWVKVATPEEARGLFRVLVLPSVNRVVIAAQRGVWTASLPPPGVSTFQWAQVSLPQLTSDVWTEVAQGPQESVLAAIAGVGFFLGVWVSGALQMRPAALPAGIGPAQIGRTSIGSCPADRRILFAVSGDQDISALLKTTDGGQSWQNLNTQVIGQPPGVTVPSKAGPAGFHNNCIGVSPVSSSVVALGWRLAGPFISLDGGRNWQMFDGNDPALHGDVNAVRFSADGGTLFIGSDGGIVSADVVRGPADRPFLRNFASAFNQRLATLQFSGWPSHQAWATFSVNRAFASGGLQDNGNVYCRWLHPQPWRQAGDSDGQLTLLLSETDMVFDNTSDRTAPTLAVWNGRKMDERGTIPLRRADGSFDPAGVTGSGSPRELFVDVVRSPLLPSRHNPAFRIAAVGGVDHKIVGLFRDDSMGYHWEQLGTTPFRAPAEFITAIASFDGRAIFIGTSAGRMFRLDPLNASLAVQLPPDPGSLVRQILLDGTTPTSLRGFARDDSGILQLAGATAQGSSGRWTRLGTVTSPPSTVFDMAVDWLTNPPTLFAATDSRVFASEDGTQWSDVSRGLPARPFCGGLQIAAGRVLLGTFGRSLWSASLVRSWSDEEDLGGVLTSAPAACAWGARRMDVFYRGQNNHLWHRAFDGHWQAEEDLGGVLTSAPAACTWGSQRIDVFYRGQNNHLWHRAFDGQWQAEEDLGGVLTSAPAACTWGSQRIDVFYRGQNNHLWHRPFDGRWQAEEDLGGGLTSSPGACSWAPGRVDIFYRGQNDHVWHQRFDGGWLGEEDLGGLLSTSPAACTWAPGRVDVFYGGRNNHLWTRVFDGGWHNEEDLGGELSEAPAACAWGVNRLDAFYRGVNQHLWHRWFPV